jgi:MFS family permease
MLPSAMKPDEPARQIPSQLGALAALQAPFFLAVWGSNLLQIFANQIHLFTVQWLVTELTPSRTLLGLAIAISGGTIALSSPIAGVLVDRFAKRDLLIIGRVGILFVILALGWGVHAGWIALWHIYVGAVLFGLLSALLQTGTQTYLYEVVGRERAQPALALNAAGMGLGQMAGPALAGLMIAIGGVVGSWTGAAAGLVLSSLLLLAVPIRGQVAPSSRAPLRELREGFAYAIGHRPLLVALLVCTMSIFNGALFAMRPVFARHVLGVGSEGMGMMAAMAGCGTLLGALAATRLPTLRRPGIPIALSMLGFSSCILLYSFAFSFHYILVIEFASGLFAQLWQIATFSGLQMAVPESMRGRVIGILFMVAQLSQVGGVFVGGLADRVGDQLAMGIFGAIPITLLLLILVLGHRVLRTLGEPTSR